jgi:hypothetical protein
VIVTGAMVAGATLGAAGIASAATGTTTTPSAGSSGTPTTPSTGSSGTPTAPPTGSSRPATPPTGAPTRPPAGAGDPATLAHGPDETLLTGTQLTEATTAATAAVPGATVIRAETNSSGASPYEVHLKKSDGTYVTVELNSDFAVIATVDGFGAGPAGGRPPSGSPAPAAAAS